MPLCDFGDFRSAWPQRITGELSVAQSKKELHRSLRSPRFARRRRFKRGLAAVRHIIYHFAHPAQPLCWRRGHCVMEGQAASYFGSPPMRLQLVTTKDSNDAARSKLMSLVARITEDHRTVEKDGGVLTWRSSECVIVEDVNPPQRRGECLCAARGRTGFVPRSKLLLLGYIQTPSWRDSVELDTSPIYEVPPGLLRSGDTAWDGPAASSQSQPFSDSQLQPPDPPAWQNGEGSTGDAEYVVLVDQRGCGPASKAPNGPSRSPILRPRSSLRPAARRHSSTSLLDTPHSSGSSAHSRPVLRWADSPNIIEIPSERTGRSDGQRLPSDGDYDDLNAPAEGSHSGDSVDVLSPAEQEKLSKHTAAIRELLRSFNAEAVRLSEQSDAKVLLERLHWYMEDCSGRLLRFVRPRWKSAELLAQTIPALYDACTLYHSMTQAFSTFVYVCMERSTTCADKAISRKLLKHLRPLEAHRQGYGSAIQSLEKIHWQPVEIERLADAPVTDYLGSLVASLRDINIEERSLYTTLVPSLQFLFPSTDTGEEEEVFLAHGQFRTLDRRARVARPIQDGNQTLQHRPLPKVEPALARWDNQPLAPNPPPRPPTSPTMPLSPLRRPPPPRPQQDNSPAQGTGDSAAKQAEAAPSSPETRKPFYSNNNTSTFNSNNNNINNNNNSTTSFNTCNNNNNNSSNNNSVDGKSESYHQSVAQSLKSELDSALREFRQKEERQEESLYNTPAASVESETYQVPPSSETPASELRAILKRTEPPPASPPPALSLSLVSSPVSMTPPRSSSPVPVISILSESKPDTTQAPVQTFEGASSMRRSAIRNILQRMRPSLKKGPTPAVAAAPLSEVGKLAPSSSEIGKLSSFGATTESIVHNDHATQLTSFCGDAPNVSPHSDLAIAPPLQFSNPPPPRFNEMSEADALGPLRRSNQRPGGSSRLGRSASVRHPGMRLPVRFSDEVEVSVASEPMLDGAPASVAPAIARRNSLESRNSWSHAPAEDSHGVLILAAKVESHVELVVVAIENFLQCLGQDQPPNVFVQHSKFVVVSAQKLLTATDRLGAQLSPDDAPRVLGMAHQLCECLKSVVARTKEAAMRFPNPQAMRRMLNAVEAVSRLASELKKEVERLSSQ